MFLIGWKPLVLRGFGDDVPCLPHNLPGRVVYDLLE